MPRKSRRRGPGEGTIHQRPDGTWCGQVTVGYDSTTGHRDRRTVYGPTHEVVLDKIQKIRSEVAAGLTETTLTLRDYVQTIFLPQAKDWTAPRTYESYRLHCDYLLPALGHVKLADLTPIAVLKAQARMEDAGLSPSARSKAGAALRRILAEAVRMDLVPKNVAMSVPLPRHTVPEIRPLTEAEIGRLLDSASRTDYYALIHLALDTGARFGELVALVWDDFDPTAGTVTITKSLEEKSGRLRIKEPKTPSSRRRLVISVGSVQALQAQREWAHPTPLRPILFPNSVGRYFRRNVFRRSVWHPLLVGAGLPCSIRFHDLRHTMASQLLHAGEPIQAVAARLGHSGSHLLLKTYGHVLPAAHGQLAATMGTILGSSVAVVADSTLRPAQLDLT
jgi:integrase